MSRSLIDIRPCTLIYLLLISLTLLTWYIGSSSLHGLAIVFFVLGLSLFKGFLIGDYYMGLKPVRSFWRYAIIIWLLLPGSMIALAFYHSY